MIRHRMTRNDGSISKLIGGMNLRPDVTAQNNGEGRLPSMAPLANPYVPFQLEDPPKYEPGKALIRGTAFPGLELPFMGMINQTEQPVTPKTELQTLAFMVQELALYLDTHPQDAQALDLYRQYQKLLHQGMMTYNEQRPLTHSLPTDGDRYHWLDDPWPWEFAANKEG